MIDRDEEREWLRTSLKANDRQLLICYGRRRVGKTTLVTRILHELETPSVYYLCDQRGTHHNASSFAETCADALDDVTPAVDGFGDAFEYLAARVEGEFVVALDEFSYLVEEDDSVPSVFQSVVDEVLDGTAVSIVLLGSSISMMEEGVLSYESPLYGRRTGQWRLEPLSLGDAAGFFPEYDAQSLVEVYAVVGGIPAYLDQLDPTEDVLTNVERHVLSKGSFLYEEPEFLLRQELREPATYMAIIEAIAGGASRVTEIANEIDKDASSLSRYLDNLARLALVERETPVTAPNSRGTYKLTDHFIRFWFRYVHVNRGTLEQGHTEPVRAAVAGTLSEHASWTFEDVCRQATRRPSFPVDCSLVGRWWYDGHEVDVAGIDESTDTLLLGECKWTANSVGPDVLTALEEIEPEVRWHGEDRSVEFALFSKSGFDTEVQNVVANREDVHLFTVEDVVSLF